MSLSYTPACLFHLFLFFFVVALLYIPCLHPLFIVHCSSFIVLCSSPLQFVISLSVSFVHTLSSLSSPLSLLFSFSSRRFSAGESQSLHSSCSNQPSFYF
ncbi:hypothetical protein GALMADRAFT_1086461 [Galerina marginata CBS 339.88]|uniref:Uncharacterized protein n=1 Tax=Galerina marginata (strain CBS 339.88) TaxID=685588 RepID=A0A067S995_GALM3|nr:hypothetical protein GALMADRAFT_1086461 [Galerina marginata CBS 339.88]